MKARAELRPATPLDWGQHSIRRARELGFRGLQFNFVVSTNYAAVKLWKSLGFKVVGTLPGAFHHPAGDIVDSYVMFLDLGQKSGIAAL